MNGTFKDALAPIVKLNSIQTRLGGELTRQALSTGQELCQSSAEQIQKLSTSKNLNDIYSVYSNWFSEAMPKMFQSAQQCLETVMESATEYQALAKESVETKKAE